MIRNNPYAKARRKIRHNNRIVKALKNKLLKVNKSLNTALTQKWYFDNFNTDMSDEELSAMRKELKKITDLET